MKNINYIIEKMKKILMIAALLILVLLIGCQPQAVSKEMLVGSWQQDYYDQLWEARQPVFSIVLTDDGFLYLKSYFDATDVGWHTEEYEYLYFVDNNAIVCLRPPFSKYYTEINLEYWNGKLTLTFTNSSPKQKVVFHKSSEILPFGYTPSDKEIIEEKENAVRNDIISFASELSKTLNLPLEPGEENSSYITNMIKGVEFSSSGNTILIITRKSPNERDNGEYYFNIPPEGLHSELPCFVVGEYAIILHINPDIEDTEPGNSAEWRAALESLSD